MPENDSAGKQPRSDSEHSTPTPALYPEKGTPTGRRTADYLTMSRSIAAAGARFDAATVVAALDTSPTLFSNLG